MPKSLFVDPNVVREPRKVTFNEIPVNQYNILILKKNYCVYYIIMGKKVLQS